MKADERIDSSVPLDVLLEFETDRCRVFAVCIRHAHNGFDQ
jgi:hypothetical protein